MAGQLDTYNKEIFNFLRTVTIKFDAFAYNMGDAYMTAHNLDSPHFIENPYYQFLNGQYPDGFTKMMVTTVEDSTQVEFNRELITKYPQTAALYRIPNKEYDILEENYPDNAGLIRTIVYPISDIEAAMDAPNLSLLAYDDSLLESNERADLIDCLKEFLEYVRKRWWVDAFVYEDLYPITFWGMLWQMLPLVLLTRRFNNIRTPYAHSYHIWEYLQSRGLKDYRDILTAKQANWLYRNIDYIHANRGKNQNLLLLAENLLPDVAVSLLYYDMYQETETRWDEQLSTNPMFRTYQLVDDEYVEDVPFSELNQKLYMQNMEERVDAEFVDETELKLARHGHNILPTKFLEFKKEPIDTRNENMMINFFLDTLFYRFSKGKISYECIFKDPVSTAEFRLSIPDTILLWNYAMHKSVGNTPSVIPNKAVVWTPFKLKYPGKTFVNRYFYSNTHKYLQATILDLDALGELIPWSDLEYTKSKEFMTNVADQFAALVYIKRLAEQSARKEYHDSLMLYLNDVMDPQVVTLNLTSASNYENWSRTGDIGTLLEQYRDYTDPIDLEKFYGALAKACFDALCPTDNLEMGAINTTKNMETVYNTIRDLFIRLGSYDVFYLETERTRNGYLTYPDPDFYCFTAMDIRMDNVFSWAHETYKTSCIPKLDLGVQNISSDLGISTVIPTYDYTDTTAWDAGITHMRINFNFKLTMPVVNEITNFQIQWSCSEIPVNTDSQFITLKD